MKPTDIAVTLTLTQAEHLSLACTFQIMNATELDVLNRTTLAEIRDLLRKQIREKRNEQAIMAAQGRCTHCED